MSSAAKTGVSLNTGNATKNLRKLVTQLDRTVGSFNALNNAMRQTASASRQANAGFSLFGKNANKQSGLIRGMVSKLGGLVAAYASVQSAQKVIGEVDTYTNNMARLNVMNDGLQTTNELYHKIYQSAQRSRAPMNEVAATVSKLGIVAKDAFSSNDEIIAFTETFNKAAALSGASHSERANAMYQLSQAFASGRLQGDELRSVRENAPLIFKAIEDEMKKQFGDGIDVKNLAAKGLIKPEIIKAAALKTAKDIDKAYKNMPMTFAQLMTQGFNKIRTAVAPMLKEMSAFFNSSGFKNAFNQSVNYVIKGVYILWGVLKKVSSVVSGVINTLWHYKEVIGIIVGIMGAWKVATMLVATWHGILAVKTAILTFVEAVRKVGIGMTILMYGKLNQVQLANMMLNIKMFLIILLIIGALYLIIKNLDYVYAIGYWVADALSNVWLWFKDTLNSCWLNLKFNALGTFSAIYEFGLKVAQGIANAFVKAFNGIAGLINGLVGKVGDTKLGKKLGLNNLKIDKMKEVDLVGSSDVLKSVQREQSKISGELARAKANKPQYKNLNDSWNAGKKEGASVRDEGLGFIKDKIKGLTDIGKVGDTTIPTDTDIDTKFGKIGDLDSFGKDPTKDALAKNTKALNDNTAAQNKGEDNYELMLEVMRQRAINRVGNSGGVVKIEMTNNNNLNSKLDIKGFITEMVNAITEAASTSAQGVHN